MSVIDEIKNKAKANKKTVVLPETTDMRTLTAAAEVISEEIADIILVGKEDEIKAKAEAEGLDLAKASFVDPENCDHLNTYIESLCEARKSKGLTPEEALQTAKADYTLEYDWFLVVTPTVLRSNNGKSWRCRRNGSRSDQLFCKRTSCSTSGC